MKLVLGSLEKFNGNEISALVILAEGEKVLGTLPKDKKSFQEQIKTITQNQNAKILNDSLEIIWSEKQIIAVLQVPQKKGLDKADKLRLAASRILDFQKNRSLKSLALCLDKASENDFRSLCEGLLISNYEFRKFKSEKKSETKIDPELHLLVSASSLKAFTKILAEAEIVCRQINLCRDLVNEPGSNLDPEVFTQYAAKMAKEFSLSIKIRNEKQLQQEGYLGLWTVGKGSDRPPRMVTLGYDGRKNSAKTQIGKTKKSGAGKSTLPHLCFVGKGVTFDTGGISLKPSASMWEMKCDMAGAATAISALCAVAALKLPIKVTTVLCLAENRPGNAAVLPGDIFTAKNGKTIMVDNTDAEGRLILTDGLAEAGALEATHIIDLATLTGAVVRALGPSIAGLFCNDAKFTQTILKAGESVSEKFCALPLEEEYREYLDDPVADMKNVGKSEGGAITAALFLQEFVPAKTAWSHFDIAGTAFTTSTWKYYKPGGTAWGMKTLVETARKLAGN